MNKILFKDKKKVSIFMTDEKCKELRKASIDMGQSLSEFLTNAGTAKANEVKKIRERRRL